jgi:hypothetical protein
MTTGEVIANTVSVVALGVVIALGASCTRVPASIQKHTVPPNFYYIPQDRLESSMWILAAEVRRLNELLRATPDGANVGVQREIQSSLRRMAAAVEQIDSPGRTTQHPALNRHTSRFAGRIARAQRGADRTPPNYFQASALSGSCFLCHGSVDDE